MNLESYLEKIVRTVSQHGFLVQAVEGGSEPPFSYTIGLAYQFNHPELIITGVPCQIAHHYIHQLAHGIEKVGHYLKPQTKLSELIKLGNIAVVELPPSAFDTHLIQAQNFYSIISWRQPLRSLQLVFPDSHQQYPWEPDYQNDQIPQPLLGRVSPHFTEAINMHRVLTQANHIAGRKLKTYQNLISQIRRPQSLTIHSFKAIQEIQANPNRFAIANGVRALVMEQEYRHLSPEALRRALIVALQIDDTSTLFAEAL